jgi:hypothetical protein
MRQVGTWPLWIGNRGDVPDAAAVARTGVRAVVDVAVDEPPISMGRELVSCRFPLLDGAGNSLGIVCAAIQTVATLVRARVPTLVVCSAGMSRAPAVAAGALAVVTGNSAEECLKLSIAGGPADLSAGFWGQVATAAVVASRSADSGVRPLPSS